MLTRTIHRLESLNVDIYTRIKQMIANRQLLPGMRLVQQTLARQFGTSSMPIVEALRRLERDGLVTHVPHLGSFVREFTTEDLHDLYAVRSGLEPEACRLFVQQATSAERGYLGELNHQLQRAIADGDQRQCVEADFAFHMHIVTCSQMPRLIATIENCHIEEQLVLRQAGMTPILSAMNITFTHDEILNAIDTGDEAQAAAALRAHLCQSEQYHMKSMNQR